MTEGKSPPSLLLFFVVADTMFEQQPCQKPPGPIVQADQSVYIQVGIAVIPGTHVKFAQKPSGGVFGGKNQHHVDEAPHQNILFAENFVDGSHSSCHAIDGKHQQRGVAHKTLVVVTVEMTQTGGKKLHGPSNETAFNKIILHGVSMTGVVWNYAREIIKS